MTRRYYVPWLYLDFWDRMGVLVGTWHVTTVRGVACALMTYSAARRRLGSQLHRIQAQLGGPSDD